MEKKRKGNQTRLETVSDNSAEPSLEHKQQLW